MPSDKFVVLALEFPEATGPDYTVGDAGDAANEIEGVWTGTVGKLLSFPYGHYTIQRISQPVFPGQYSLGVARRIRA